MILYSENHNEQNKIYDSESHHSCIADIFLRISFPVFVSKHHSESTMALKSCCVICIGWVSYPFSVNTICLFLHLFSPTTLA